MPNVSLSQFLSLVQEVIWCRLKAELHNMNFWETSQCSLNPVLKPSATYHAAESSDFLDETNGLDSFQYGFSLGDWWMILCRELEGVWVDSPPEVGYMLMGEPYHPLLSYL